MRFHEAANLFPLLDGEAFDELVGDIKAHGQEQPITVYQRQILDGRNRYNACRRLGIEPRYAYRDDIADPIAYVVTLNIHRRHLTPSQRAAIAAEAMGLFKAEAKKRQLATLKQNQNADAPDRSHQLVGTDTPPSTARGEAAEFAAKAFDVGQGTVIRAEQVMKAAPELHERVKAGELSGYAAYYETKARRQRQQEGAPPRTRQEGTEDVAPARRHTPPTKRPERTAEVAAVVAAYDDVRDRILKASWRDAAEAIGDDDARRIENAHRELVGWYSKFATLRAERRLNEQRRAQAEATAVGAQR